MQMPSSCIVPNCSFLLLNTSPLFREMRLTKGKEFCLDYTEQCIVRHPLVMENKQPISLKWAAGIWQLGHTWDIANPRILEKMGISSAPTSLLSFYSTEGGDRQEREYEIRVY